MATLAGKALAWLLSNVWETRSRMGTLFGVNQDGRTPGMTVPSKAAQEGLIRSVYDSAGLRLEDTDFVEAHGTGTAQGDPIEAGAIISTWKERNRDSPLYIGAIKSSIGHLEGASGVAGVIKTVMALERAIIPPNINFEKLNPKICVPEGKFEVRSKSGWINCLWRCRVC